MNIEESVQYFKGKYLEEGDNITITVDFLDSLETVLSELEKKDKVINEMAGFIEVFELDNEIVKTYCDGTYENCKHKEDIGTCKSCIKEYFTNKVEREDIKE